MWTKHRHNCITHKFVLGLCIYLCLSGIGVYAAPTVDKNAEDSSHWLNKQPFTQQKTQTNKSKNNKTPKQQTEKAWDHVLKQSSPYSTLSNKHEPQVPGIRRPHFERLSDPTDKMMLTSQQSTISDGAYAIGPTKIRARYTHTNDLTPEKLDRLMDPKTAYDPTKEDPIQTRGDKDKWHLGVEYGTNKASVNMAVDYSQYKNSKNDIPSNDNPADMKTFSLGYTFNVSNRTSLYSSVSHTQYENEALSNSPDNNADTDVTSFRFGVNHKF